MPIARAAISGGNGVFAGITPTTLSSISASIPTIRHWIKRVVFQSMSGVLLPSRLARASPMGKRPLRSSGKLSVIADGLEADSLQVGGSLHMRSEDQNMATFNDVNLRGARITGEVFMNGAGFRGKLKAGFLQVDGSLHMSTDGREANFKSVDLGEAKIARQITMIGSNFDGALTAHALHVGGDLIMRNAHCADDANMTGANIGGNPDLRASTFAGLDLSGASISEDLRLGGAGDSAVWKRKNGEPGVLILDNTHIGNLADAKDAWPEKGQLYLDGFTFSRLGVRDRSMDWWDNWARRDPGYSPMPYAQLAAALTSAGDRDAANEIRYLGRVRERETEKRWTYIWSGLLQYVAGFGIGSYTFRVLYWVIGISFFGAAVLWTTVPAAKQHGPIWCVGASLSRLLPGIEINKEFSEFFNDPERKRLTAGWQVFIFSVIGVIGFVLGAVLVAAVSGLTQSP